MNLNRIDSLFTSYETESYPAVVLENPKFARNISMVIRIMAGFLNHANLFITSKRFYDSLKQDVRRLPREERMKAYHNVDLIYHTKPLNLLKGTPVCVELVNGAVPLPYFNHPEKAIYIFGAEDGGVSKALRVQCHHFIYIPTNACFNLATTVGMVLYDRYSKEK